MYSIVRLSVLAHLECCRIQLIHLHSYWLNNLYRPLQTYTYGLLQSYARSTNETTFQITGNRIIFVKYSMHAKSIFGKLETLEKQLNITV